VSDFPRDLRQATFEEVPLSIEEVAHGVWDGVIFGPRAWRVLGDRISTQSDVMRSKMVPRGCAGAVLQSRLAAGGRTAMFVDME